jgi:hypothetical protein
MFSLPCLRLLPVLPALCLAQTPEATNQKILEELRSIRTSIERLENSQRAMLALARLQNDQNQVALVESRRQKLAAQEQDLSKEIAAASRAIETPVMVVPPPDGSAPSSPPDLGPLRARVAQASATLREVAGSRQALDLEIARLRERIAAMQKLIDDALR